MSLLSVVGDLISGGGLTGLVSAGVGAFAKHKQLKLELEHERKTMAYEIKMQEIQIQADQVMAEHELLVQTEKGAGEAFGSAIAAEAGLSQLKTHMWVNDVRSLFRPFLTLVLWILAGMILFLAPESDSVYFTTITHAVVQSAAGATGFWFGSRAIKTSNS